MGRDRKQNSRIVLHRLGCGALRLSVGDVRLLPCTSSIFPNLKSPPSRPSPDGTPLLHRPRASQSLHSNRATCSQPVARTCNISYERWFRNTCKNGVPLSVLLGVAASSPSFLPWDCAWPFIIAATSLMTSSPFLCRSVLSGLNLEYARSRLPDKPYKRYE